LRNGTKQKKRDGPKEHSERRKKETTVHITQTLKEG
jgi:hypothetical protein